MSDRTLPRIAIIHSQLKGGGGSEARAMWMAEALKTLSRVTLMSMGPIDLNRLNRIYGTKLFAGEIDLVTLPVPRMLRRRFDALRSYRLVRYVRDRAADFEVLISAYNVMDFGRRGIQFVADFSFDDELRRRFSPSIGGLKGLAYRNTPARSLYLSLGRWLAKESKYGWQRNVTVANSHWSQSELEHKYGIKSRVIYPPVADFAQPLDWNRRENGFVLLARLSPEKQIERAIAIVGGIRQKGYGVHLHILGQGNDSGYLKFLRRICKDKQDWVTFEGLVIGEEKRQILIRHRFGISACPNEPFGVAVAELVKAGCLVWVPDGGGQVEIVDHSDLVYASVDKCISTIIRTLESKPRRSALLKHLSRQAKLFNSKRFVSDVSELVKDFLNTERRRHTTFSHNALRYEARLD